MIARVLLLLSCGVVALQAQAPGDTAVLAPVTVTATRVAVDARATPAAVTVISGEELRARGVVRLADALRAVPGASVVPSGSFGSQTSLFLRGGESDYTKVMIDGVAVNAAGGSIDLAHLTVADVERIEIVRGPASVLYGSDAMTGVIQIFTTRARDQTDVDVTARGGTYDTRDAAALATVARGPASFTASAGTLDTDGVLSFNNQYRNRHISASARVSPRQGVQVRASLRHTDATYHFPTDFLGNAVDSNQYRREKRLVGSVDASAALSQILSAQLTLGVSALDGINDNQADRPDDFAFHDESEALRRVIDGRIDARIAPLVMVSAGAEWTAEDEENTSNFEASRINRGYYAQLLAGEGTPVLLALGGRLEDNERFGSHTTARIGATYRAAAATRFRAAYGTAFKEPAFAEVFTTSFTRGNPSLGPEQSRSVEVGVEQHLARTRALVRLTWFGQRFRDRIDFVPFPADSSTFGTYANIGRADASGLEAELELQLRGDLTVTGSYAYLATKITRDESGREGQRLLRRPAHSASATVAYTRALGGLSATLHRVGSRHDIGYELLPWYTTVDVAGSVSLLRQRAIDLRLTTRIENALDEDFEAIRGFRTPGRTALVGVRATFGR